MSDVFISYSRRDSESFAERLTRALEAENLDVWVDLDDIPAASDWRRDLGEGVLASEYVCFVISPGSVASEHCAAELEHATERNKRLLPLVHVPVEDGRIPDAVRRLNWIPQRGAFEDDFERSVQTLVAAIRTDLDTLRAHTRWQQRAEEWRSRDRNPSLLAHGTEIREAEDWLAAQANAQPAPTPLQVEYINASRRAAARHQRMLLAGALAALLVSIGVGVYAFIERNHAREERDLARSNELSAAALASADTDPELALMLAVEAAETRATPRSEQALARAVTESRLRGVVHVGAKPYHAAQSPDGRWLAVGTAEGLDLYDGQTGELLRELDAGGAVYEVAFTPDSASLYAGGEDETIRRFAVPGGELGDEIEVPTPVSSLAVSERGVLLAATTTSGDVVLFDSDGRPYRRLRGHDDEVIAVDFAARGGALVSASVDGTVRVWNASSGEGLAVLRGGAGRYRDADVSANGQTAVTLDFRGVVRVWDVSSERMVRELNDIFAQGRAHSIDLSPDEAQALISGTDGRARLVDLEDGRTVESFGGHAGAVRDADVGGEGKAVVTTGQQDETVRFFDSGSPELALPETEAAIAAAVDPAGELIATVGDDGLLNVFARADARQVGEVRASEGRIYDVSFSSDGERVVTSDEHGDARVWEVGELRQTGPALAHGGAVNEAAFDPEGGRVATASLDGTVRVWDLAGAADSELASADYVHAVDWNTDGTLIAIAAQTFRATRVRVLDAATGDEVSSFPARGALTLAFDPEGARVAVGGLSGSAEIRDARTGELLTALGSQLGRVESVRFSPGGDRVVTASPGGTAVWDASSGFLLATYPEASLDAVPIPAGELVTVHRETRAVEVHECEVCGADAGELLEIARSRLFREPTDAERERYGID